MPFARSPRPMAIRSPGPISAPDLVQDGQPKRIWAARKTLPQLLRKLKARVPGGNHALSQLRRGADSVRTCPPQHGLRRGLPQLVFTRSGRARPAQPLSGGSPKQIVLLIHGYGSSGADIISLAPHWQQALPDAIFLAPNAPQRCGMTVGYQWWGLKAFTPQALASGASSAAPAIDAFIDRKFDQYGLTESDLALVGFSQGTMMALHIGLRRERQLAGIVGYSGMLTNAATLSREAKASRLCYSCTDRWTRLSRSRRCMLPGAVSSVSELRSRLMSPTAWDIASIRWG